MRGQVRIIHAMLIIQAKFICMQSEKRYHKSGRFGIVFPSFNNGTKNYT